MQRTLRHLDNVLGNWIYCVFNYEKRLKWHFSVAHLLRLHHIKLSSEAVLMFHFKLHSHGLNYPLQILLMLFTSFVFIPPTDSAKPTLPPCHNNTTDASVIRYDPLVHAGAVVCFFWLCIE